MVMRVETMEPIPSDLLPLRQIYTILVAGKSYIFACLHYIITPH